jgi:hypothetical protein
LAGPGMMLNDALMSLGFPGKFETAVSV